MDKLFEQFVKEKKFLKNVAPKTERFYRQSYKTFKRFGGELTKQGIKDFVIKMRESNLSSGACNVYIRGINSFLSWLYEEEHLTEKLRIKLLTEETKVIKVFSESQLAAIVNFKPKTFYEWRLYAMLCLLIDTGLRADEALSITKNDVDMENLFITVTGKGNKRRVIAFSIEYRKILWNYLKKRKYPGDLLFPTTSGTKIGYRNFYRDMVVLCQRLGIEGVRVSPHTLRHTFAYSYAKNGGNILYLQKMLGHTTLQMTRRYVDLQPEDLREMQAKTSLLGRLR